MYPESTASAAPAAGTVPLADRRLRLDDIVTLMVADGLSRILKRDIQLVFGNPVDIRRYIGEFFNLARSMKKAQENSRGEFSLARNFEQLVELGRHGHLDANDQHVVHVVDWLWQYA